MAYQTTTEPKRHAIVIGGSIAGLLASRVLLNHFDRVTLIERDRPEGAADAQSLPVSPTFRPGVPQARHVHVLLVRGQQLLEQFFPGIMAELVAAGAPSLDFTADWRLTGTWGLFPRIQADLKGVTCSRILLEQMIYRRIQANPHLTLLTETQVKELLTNADRSRVTGVQIKQPDQPIENLEADLVVDASGRNSALPNWLQAMGYVAPEETVINSFLGYATRWYQRPPGFQADWQGINIAPHPVYSRQSTLYPVEGDRWVLTVAGVAKDQPPTDEAGFLAFVRSLRDSSIYDAIRQAEPLSPIYAYRRTENRWRHYERLDRFPAGIVAVGDAVCSFNPVYGQGMTVAALSASLLDQCLATDKPLTPRFQQQLTRLLATPWSMATTEDCRWPTTEGPRPQGISTWLQRYSDQLILVATERDEVFATFARVIHFVDPPTAFFHPKILAQVLPSFFNQRLKRKMTG